MALNDTIKKNFIFFFLVNMLELSWCYQKNKCPSTQQCGVFDQEETTE